MKPSDVFDYFGSKSAAARALGLKVPSVCEWEWKGVVPWQKQIQYEALTGGALVHDPQAIPEELRPYVRIPARRRKHHRTAFFRPALSSAVNGE